MRLANAEHAIIPSEKLRDYLLSASHPTGRFKAVFFRSLGYQSSDHLLLETDLRTLLAGDAEPAGSNNFGEKYTVRGRVTGPNGRAAEIVTVWIILTGKSTPLFVTAYPEG